MKKITFKIGDVKIGLNEDLFVIAGPCVIESEKVCIDIAEKLLQISKDTNIPLIFKASFDKANRSSISSFRGSGLEEGLRILSRVRDVTGLAVMTDIHEPAQAERACDLVDCLQIPAFLTGNKTPNF